MVKGLGEAELSRKRQVKVRFLPGTKLNYSHYLVSFLTSNPDNVIILRGPNDALYKNEDDVY